VPTVAVGHVADLALQHRRAYRGEHLNEPSAIVRQRLDSSARAVRGFAAWPAPPAAPSPQRAARHAGHATSSARLSTALERVEGLQADRRLLERLGRGSRGLGRSRHADPRHHPNRRRIPAARPRPCTAAVGNARTDRKDIGIPAPPQHDKRGPGTANSGHRVRVMRLLALASTSGCLPGPLTNGYRGAPWSWSSRCCGGGCTGSDGSADLGDMFEQPLDHAQPQTEPLQALDGPQPIHRRLVIGTVVRRGALRRRQQASLRPRHRPHRHNGYAAPSPWLVRSRRTPAPLDRHRSQCRAVPEAGARSPSHSTALAGPERIAGRIARRSHSASTRLRTEHRAGAGRRQKPRGA
jgi:hypothetical protein